MTLGVLAGHRRNGLAKELLHRILSAFQPSNYSLPSTFPSRVFLHVQVENAAAMALYTRAGFRTLGLVPGYYDPRVMQPRGLAPDAYLLCKPL